jgi:hypothetical protein
LIKIYYLQSFYSRSTAGQIPQVPILFFDSRQSFFYTWFLCMLYSIDIWHKDSYYAFIVLSISLLLWH